MGGRMDGWMDECFFSSGNWEVHSFQRLISEVFDFFFFFDDVRCVAKTRDDELRKEDWKGRLIHRWMDE